MATERLFYPRKKQARYVAKLSRWQKRILEALWWWEDSLGQWLWEHPGDSLWQYKKTAHADGMPWCPRQILGVNRWETMPWGPRERTDASRSLRRLEQRELVERIPFQTWPGPPGSSSLLVMMFDRTYGFETVYRNSDRKMSQLPKCLQHKDIQSPFTKNGDDPP